MIVICHFFDVDTPPTTADGRYAQMVRPAQNDDDEEPNGAAAQGRGPAGRSRNLHSIMQGLQMYEKGTRMRVSRGFRKDEIPTGSAAQGYLWNLCPKKDHGVPGALGNFGR